jgi:small subunit ribosomal protein S9
MATRKATEKAPDKYYEAVGRRKTAIARVRLTVSKQPEFIVNAKPLEILIQDAEHQRTAREAIEKGVAGKVFTVSVKVRGGGVHAQAEAMRQGISRALVKFDGELRTNLKTLGFLTRDPRMRERKKFGLKRARRARQWRKR